MALENLIARLEQWDRWPPAWEPAVGEILAGVVLDYSEGESPYGKCHVVVVDVQARRLNGKTIEHPKRFAVWLSKAVLLKEFQRVRPGIGQVIAIKYVSEPNTGCAYHQYKVLADNGAPKQMQPLGGEEPERKPQRPPAAPARRPFVSPARGPIQGELGVSHSDVVPASSLRR